RKKTINPISIASNIYYHEVLIPSWGFMRTLYISAILAIRRKLSEIQPHIVHGQGTEREAALAAVFSGFKNVITIHGNMRRMALHAHGFSKFFFKISSYLEKLALRKTGGVFCNSYYTQEMVK